MKSEIKNRNQKSQIRFTNQNSEISDQKSAKMKNRKPLNACKNRTLFPFTAFFLRTNKWDSQMCVLSESCYTKLRK
jgi:hypothetical protein